MAKLRAPGGGDQEMEEISITLPSEMVSLLQMAASTNTMSTPAARAVAINPGSRVAISCAAETSRPPLSTNPPGAQKSFCMSTTIRAAWLGRTFSSSVKSG